MPWSVRKDGDRWAIVKSNTGEVVGYSDTYEKAMAAVRARYAHSDDLPSRLARRGRRGSTVLVVALGVVVLAFWALVCYGVYCLVHGCPLCPPSKAGQELRAPAASVPRCSSEVPLCPGT
jgi:hypothetical protein